MPPFESRMPLAEPMPKVVSPRVPPELVMVPVKVLAEAGFSTQTPPSFLPTLSVAVFVPVLLVSTMFIWLKSVLAPRSSRVKDCPVALLGKVFAKEPAKTSAPEPVASMRKVLAEVWLTEEVRVQGRDEVSPGPT